MQSGESVDNAAVEKAALGNIYIVEKNCIPSPPRRLERDLRLRNTQNVERPKKSSARTFPVEHPKRVQ
ncbi:hypothetical protein AGOR_G00054850 [Albula goreensis]|uniref:Uncharacterized protein n=1 Tax=Albula goreensis TaxID=1534307 RepID=A0A8T3E2T7_9TELE|nr:hypothetical protein AGOR_G00054850 [Albula goreensis]